MQPFVAFPDEINLTDRPDAYTRHFVGQLDNAVDALDCRIDQVFNAADGRFGCRSRAVLNRRPQIAEGFDSPNNRRPNNCAESVKNLADFLQQSRKAFARIAEKSTEGRRLSVCRITARTGNIVIDGLNQAAQSFIARAD